MAVVEVVVVGPEGEGCWLGPGEEGLLGNVCAGSHREEGGLLGERQGAAKAGPVSCPPHCAGASWRGQRGHPAMPIRGTCREEGVA